MKRTVCGLLVLGFAVALASPAAAYYDEYVAVGETYRIDNTGVRTGGGGPFEMTLVTDEFGDPVDNADSWWTFCTEIGEGITLGSEYQIGSIGKVSKGSGATLDNYGAWAYLQYREGAGVAAWFNSGADGFTSKEKYEALQQAVWYSMKYDDNDDGTWDDNESDISEGDWAGSDYDKILDKIGLNIDEYAGQDVSRVVVLNMVYEDGKNAQDQIGLIPPSEVPEPGALVVWSLLGCVGLGLARVRRRKR